MIRVLRDGGGMNLISATTTNKGLQVECQLDKNAYPKRIKISDEMREQINIIRSNFMVNGTILSFRNMRSFVPVIFLQLLSNSEASEFIPGWESWG